MEKSKIFELKKPFKPNDLKGFTNFSGERGIRTPGPVTVNGFQDRRIRPLCHLSGCKINALSLIFQIIIVSRTIYNAPSAPPPISMLRHKLGKAAKASRP